MHLAVVTASISRVAGGLFHSVRSLSQTLGRLPDTCVTVLALEDQFSAADGSVWKPLQPKVFQPIGPRAFGYAAPLSDHLLAGPWDIAHTHGLWQYPSVAVSGWGGRLKKPYLISPRGMLDAWALNNSRWKKRVAGWLFENQHLRHAACIHALCQSEADSIRAYGLKNPICIIPNGIDLPEIRGQGTRDEGGNLKLERAGEGRIPFDAFISRDQLTDSLKALFSVKQSGRKVLLFLSRIHPKKGLINLLCAWAAVQRSGIRGQGSEWMLAIAGWDQGGHEAELKQLATDLSIKWADLRGRDEGGNLKLEEMHKDRTSDFRPQPSSFPSDSCLPTSDLRPLSSESCSLLFTGPLFGPDKDAAYRACDAFILPSFSEGLPMAVLEAWAYAKPVLMTPECNLPEGFAADAAIRVETSAESIQNGLESLFRLLPSELCLLGSHGRSLVANRFSWSQIASQMHEVYTWLLGGGSKPDFLVD
jgi:poly(glycerol-phosphate) alpha-glucosyltransferase